MEEEFGVVVDAGIDEDGIGYGDDDNDGVNYGILDSQISLFSSFQGRV